MNKFLLVVLLFGYAGLAHAQKLYVRYETDIPRSFVSIAAQPLSATVPTDYLRVTLLFTQDDGKTEIASYTLTPAQITRLGWADIIDWVAGGIPVDCSEPFDLNDTHWHFAGLTAESFDFVQRLSDAAYNGLDRLDRTCIDAFLRAELAKGPILGHTTLFGAAYEAAQTLSRLKSHTLEREVMEVALTPEYVSMLGLEPVAANMPLSKISTQAISDNYCNTVLIPHFHHLKTMHSYDIYDLHFSADKRWLLVPEGSGADCGKKWYLFNLRSGIALHEVLQAQKDERFRFEFSPNSQYILLAVYHRNWWGGDYSHRVQLIDLTKDVADPAHIRTIISDKPERKSFTVSLPPTFSPSSQYILLQHDGVQVVDLSKDVSDSAYLRTIIPPHDDDLPKTGVPLVDSVRPYIFSCAQFSPDNHLFVVSGAQHTLYLFDLTKSSSDKDYMQPTISNVIGFFTTFSPNGRYGVFVQACPTSGYCLHVYDFVEKQFTHKRLMPDYGFSYPQISPNNRYFIANNSRNILVFDLTARDGDPAGLRILTMPGNHDGGSVIVSPHGHFIAAAIKNEHRHYHDVCVWDLDKGPEHVKIIHNILERKIQFSPNETMLVSQRCDGVLMLHTLTGADFYLDNPRKISCNTRFYLADLHFSPDERYLIIADHAGVENNRGLEEKASGVEVTVYDLAVPGDARKISHWTRPAKSFGVTNLFCSRLELTSDWCHLAVACVYGNGYRSPDVRATYLLNTPQELESVPVIGQLLMLAYAQNHTLSIEQCANLREVYQILPTAARSWLNIKTRTKFAATISTGWIKAQMRSLVKKVKRNESSAAQSCVIGDTMQTEAAQPSMLTTETTAAHTEKKDAEPVSIEEKIERYLAQHNFEEADALFEEYRDQIFDHALVNKFERILAQWHKRSGVGSSK